MSSRLELHRDLLVICNNVYYQAPSATQIKYPCIMYTKNNIKDNNANNTSYIRKVGYTITVIDKNPDSTIFDKVSTMEYCSFDRRYVNDGLNHEVYNLYY